MKKTVAIMMVLTLLMSFILPFGATAEQTERPAQTAAALETTQAVEPTPAPASGEQTGSEEAQPIVEPTAAPEGDAQQGTTPEESVTPDESVSPEESPAPEEEIEEGEPEQTETPTETPAQTITIGSGAAYRADGNVITYGDPASMVQSMLDAGEAGTVYLCQSVSFTVSCSSVETFANSGVTIALDAAATDDPDDMVIVSNVSRGGQVEAGVLYIWVGRQSSIPTAQSVADAQQSVEQALSREDSSPDITLTVQPVGYAANEACTPTFMLSASAELTAGQSYAVSINGGERMTLKGSSYAPTATGTYRFYVLSANGSTLASSTEYEVVYMAANEQPSADEQEQPADTQAEQETAQAEPVIELEVQVTGYEPNAVLTTAPVFTLYGKPDDGAYGYAVVTNGSSALFLDTNTYTPTDAGDYQLRFYIVKKGDSNNAVARSDTYLFIYDPPMQVSMFSMGLSTTGTRETAQAWKANPDDANAPYYGTLEQLVSGASAGETVYLLVSGPITIGVQSLGGVTLAPDSSAFTNHYVKVESISGGLSVSVVENGAGDTSAPTTLTVTPSADYLDGAWSSTRPTFTLVPDVALSAGQSLAVLTDESATAVAITSPYTAPNVEGKHIYTFAVLGSNGQVVQSTKSAAYAVWLDTSAPSATVAVDKGVLTITATDSVSSPALVSVDGGKTWSPLTVDDATGKATWRYSVTQATTFVVGSLLVRDSAGNEFTNTTALTVTPDGQSSGGMQGGSGSASGGGASGGGASSASSRTVYHASSTYDSTMAYNAVDLSVEDLAMNELTVGDQSLDLALYDQSGSEALFTASLAHWNQSQGVTEAAQAGDATADTLVLTALASNETDFQWAFTGNVHKKLQASGISYLVLKVGNSVTAMSTAGFTAGIRYDLLKAQGTASKAFMYNVDMSVNGAGMTMQLSVDGQSYALTGDLNSDIYYYNVFSGTADLLKVAFGEYAKTSQG